MSRRKEVSVPFSDKLREFTLSFRLGRRTGGQWWFREDVRGVVLMFRYVRQEECSARRGQEMPLFSFSLPEGSPSTANAVVSSAVLLLLRLTGGTVEGKSHRRS